MAKKSAEAAQLTLKPLDDRVVVEPSVAEEKTAGGILLPDTAKQKPQQGTVVSIGPGKLNDDGSRTALAVKIGDTVLYGKYSGSDVEVNGKEFKILRESDILAKLDERSLSKLVCYYKAGMLPIRLWVTSPRP